MKTRIFAAFTVWLLISAIGSGCGNKQILRSSENSKDYNNEPLGANTKPATSTTITKEALRERLSRKNVEFIENSPCDKPTPGGASDIPEPTVKKTESATCGKPDPLTLEIKIVKGYRNSFKAQLNNEEYDFGGLVAKLKTIFKERETDQVYRNDGTNIVEKRVNLAAREADIPYYEKDDITVEDFERLIDDLRKEGIDEIRIDFVETRKLVTDADSSPGSAIPKTISGGVINAKAVNLVQPNYPAAAKAVKASGAVNVQVTIDESGNVESAEAVSGHPLLRQAAVQAVRASKFSITKLGGQPVKVSGIIVYNFKPE